LKGEAKGAKGEKGEAKGKSKRPGQGPAQGVQLCVKNLVKEATSEELRALFAPFGKITNVQVKTDTEGKCRGFGFVSFDTMEEAERAIADMHLKTVNNKQLNVVFSDWQKEADGKGSAAPGKGKADGDAKGKGKGKGKGKAQGKGQSKGQVMTPQYMGNAEQMAYMAAYYNLYAGYGAQMPYAMPYGYDPSTYMNAQMLATGVMPQGYPASMMSPVAMQQAAVAASGYGMYPAAAPASPSGAAAQLASGVAAAAAAAQTQKVPPTPTDTSRMYEGILKSVSAKNGYGFITNEEMKEVYKRDVYVDRALLPEAAKVGDKMKFTVRLSEKGHPSAVTAVVV